MSFRLRAWFATLFLTAGFAWPQPGDLLREVDTFKVAPTKAKIERSAAFTIVAQSAVLPSLTGYSTAADVTLHVANLASTSVIFPDRCFHLAVITPTGDRLASKLNRSLSVKPILLQPNGVYAFDRRLDLVVLDKGRRFKLVEYAVKDYVGTDLIQEFEPIAPGKYLLEYIYDSTAFDASIFKTSVWKSTVTTNRAAFEILDPNKVK